MPLPGPPPTARVLQSFGVTEPATALPGGQGTSWRAGPLVLKPSPGDAETTWLGHTLHALEPAGCRVAAPVPAQDGRWVVDGWAATRWAAGEPGPGGRWTEVLSAARGFHAALRRVPRPAFLDAREHWWARADRSAWGEAPAPPVPGLGRLRAELLRFAAPLDEPAQLVHGDLAGNVLFQEGLLPAVIDVSPYWRPATYAEAVIFADGLLWWGGAIDLVTAAGPAGQPAWLARALTFRLDVLGNQLADSAGTPSDADLAPFTRALEVLEAHAGR